MPTEPETREDPARLATIETGRRVLRTEAAALSLFADALVLFDRVKERPTEIQVIGRSLGSGVATVGGIVTSHHIVDRAATIRVHLAGRSWIATPTHRQVLLETEARCHMDPAEGEDWRRFGLRASDYQLSV